MQTTQPSTSELMARLGALGQPYYGQACALFDELQHYRDAPAHARQARTDRIEAAIKQCYRDHQAHLEALPLRQRTRELAAKMARALARPSCRYDLADVPDIRIVRRVVYRLAGR